MAVITDSFEWNKAKFITQKPNGFSRQRLWRLNQLLNEFGSDDIPIRDARGIAFYLANTVCCEGDPGFPVPVQDATHSELMKFIRGVGEADQSLIDAYDDSILRAMHVTNDSDLLPPEELDAKKKKTPESSSSG